jgi:hypothetical protein
VASIDMRDVRDVCRAPFAPKPDAPSRRTPPGGAPVMPTSTLLASRTNLPADLGSLGG